MKNLPTAIHNALLTGYLIPRLFMKGEFESGTHGFWTDVGDVSVDGVNYYGSGALATVSAIGGVSDLSVPGVTVTLSGINAATFDSFFSEVWHQKPMTLAIGFLDPDSRDLLATPGVEFSGYMDDAKRKGGSKKKATLTIQCEDASWRLGRAFADVRSDANQRGRLSTDTFMKRLAVAAQRTVYWNQPAPATAKQAGR